METLFTRVETIPIAKRIPIAAAFLGRSQPRGFAFRTNQSSRPARTRAVLATNPTTALEIYLFRPANTNSPLQACSQQKATHRGQSEGRRTSSGKDVLLISKDRADRSGTSGTYTLIYTVLENRNPHAFPIPSETTFREAVSKLGHPISGGLGKPHGNRGNYFDVGLVRLVRKKFSRFARSPFYSLGPHAVPRPLHQRI
jgi:hypothetical protein